MGFQRFKLDREPESWIHPVTGEIQESMAKLTVTDGYLGIEGIFSKAEDMKYYGDDHPDKVPDIVVAPEDDENHELFRNEERPKRGKVTDFTRASQNRFIKSVSIWEPVGTGLMLTLTYPKHWPDGKTVQAHFRAFRMRMLRDHPYWAGCWKLEYQKRGAPHFHMIIDTNAKLDFIYPLRAWVRRAWNEVRGDNIKAFIQCEFLRDNHKGKYYLTKEVGKTVQSSKAWRAKIEAEIDHVGRFWGWMNKKWLHRSGEQYYVPAKLGCLIKEKIQQLSVRDMISKGVIVERDGKQYFSRDNTEVKPHLLRAWRLSQFADYQWEMLCKEIYQEHHIDINDYMEPIFETKPPPK